MLEALSRTQGTLADEIRMLIAEERLPGAVLFGGPKGSSKLTAALDASFALTGEEQLRPVLRSRSVLYLSSRNMRVETEAAISLFRKQRTERSRMFLIDTVRRTLLQYHGAIAPLYDGKKSSVRIRDEEGRGGSLFSNAQAIDAIMLSLEDGMPEENEIDRIASTLQQRTADDFFTMGKKTPGATIDEIRAVQDWLEEGSDEKCVIIENPEDFTEGAKNSMLKMLEEPPMHSHLFLISEHPARILPTILSRLRRFQFPELSAAAVSSFIGETFAIYTSYPSFSSFFFEEGTDEDDRRKMDEAVSLYSSALLAGKMLTLDQENEVFGILDRLGYGIFTERVTERIGEEIGRGTSAQKAWSVLSSALRSADTYNMSMRTALDLALREASVGK